MQHHTLGLYNKSLYHVRKQLNQRRKQY